MSESVLVSAIVKALTLKGYWCWRANSGTQVLPATTRAARRVIKGAPAGTPDVLVVLLGGRLIGLEVKAPAGRQRPSQRVWEAKAREHGVGYAVVRSIGEAVAVVQEAQ